MSVEIHVKPEDSWDYFSHAKDILKETQVEIARNENTDTSVCITNDNGFPLFNVYRRGGKLYSEPAVREDCLGTLRSIYIKYLFPIVVSGSENSRCEPQKDKPPKKDEPKAEDDYITDPSGVIKRAVGSSGPQDLEDDIYQREDELECAVYDALTVFVGMNPEEMFGRDISVILEDMVEDICVYLAENYGISTYRPRWEEDEEDEQTCVFSEYPYDKLAESEQKDDD